MISGIHRSPASRRPAPGVTDPRDAVTDAGGNDIAGLPQGGGRQGLTRIRVEQTK